MKEWTFTLQPWKMAIAGGSMDPQSPGWIVVLLKTDVDNHLTFWLRKCASGKSVSDQKISEETYLALYKEAVDQRRMMASICQHCDTMPPSLGEIKKDLGIVKAHQWYSPPRDFREFRIHTYLSFAIGCLVVIVLALFKGEAKVIPPLLCALAVFSLLAIETVKPNEHSPEA